MDPIVIIQNIAISMVVFLISITVHELMHGYIAYLAGDPTAKDAGRLTLNPIKHLDPLGTIMLLISSFYGRGIGWAKPVPVNPNRFGSPRRDMLLVAFSGPISNFALAFLFSQLFFVLQPEPGTLLSEFLFIAITLNVSLGVFNLLPIPPLDGSTIIPVLLPHNLRQAWWQFEQYGMIILLAIVFIVPGVLSTIIGVPSRLILQLMGFAIN